MLNKKHTGKERETINEENQELSDHSLFKFDKEPKLDPDHTGKIFSLQVNHLWQLF